MRAIRSISAALNRRVTAADPVAMVRPSTPEFPDELSVIVDELRNDLN
jgi:hypothetical protein